VRRPSKATAKKEPKHLLDYEFEQTLIPIEGGRQCLRLLKRLNLRITESLRFQVKDWGIEMDCSHLPELPREVARHFFKLLNASENDALTETDQANWIRILDYIDFRQFSIERSPPRYQEGVLQGKAERVIVEWTNGTREQLRACAASALSEINVGERFGAYIKLGQNDETIGIERVSLLGCDRI